MRETYYANVNFCIAPDGSLRIWPKVNYGACLHRYGTNAAFKPGAWWVANFGVASSINPAGHECFLEL